MREGALHTHCEEDRSKGREMDCSTKQGTNDWSFSLKGWLAII